MTPICTKENLLTPTEAGSEESQRPKPRLRPLALTDFSEADLKRFWVKIDKNGPIHRHNPALGRCWMWTKSRNPNGYGYFAMGRGAICASRTAYAISSGGISGDMVVCHSCDNPPCCNPSHLFAGTCRDNWLDYASKGYKPSKPQGRSGEANSRAFLTATDIESILKARASGETYAVIASRFRINQATVGKIVTKKAWKHIHAMKPSVDKGDLQ